MQKSELSNVNIIDEQVLITPEELKAKLPLSVFVSDTTHDES